MNASLMQSLCEAVELDLDPALRAEAEPALEQYLQQGNALVALVAELDAPIPAPVFTADA